MTGVSRNSLSDAQLDTLGDLLRKQRGDAVGWISIAVARGLTDLGLAEREPSGWRITAAGEALLEHRVAAAQGVLSVLQFPPGAPS